MIDGKTQLFADLMIYNFEVVGGIAIAVCFILLGVLMLIAKGEVMRASKNIDTTNIERILDDFPEVMGVWPNPTFATVLAALGDMRTATLAECEAIARLHQTFSLDDFPPAFNGGYRGAAENIADAIAALKK